jgi:hypothetical protein
MVAVAEMDQLIAQATPHIEAIKGLIPEYFESGCPVIVYRWNADGSVYSTMVRDTNMECLPSWWYGWTALYFHSMMAGYRDLFIKHQSRKEYLVARSYRDGFKNNLKEFYKHAEGVVSHM